jgi:hypothetical protein
VDQACERRAGEWKGPAAAGEGGGNADEGFQGDDFGSAPEIAFPEEEKAEESWFQDQGQESKGEKDQRRRR